MLHAQVLVYLSVGLKCRKFCWDSCADTLCVNAIFPSEMLDAQVLVCLSVGSSVGSSADVNAQVLVCTYQLGSSVGSSADVGCTGTSVPISWVEVLEVLWMLDAQVLVYLSIGLKCWKFCA